MATIADNSTACSTRQDTRTLYCWESEEFWRKMLHSESLRTTYYYPVPDTSLRYTYAYKYMYYTIYMYMYHAHMYNC
jgi:hypothetical protein